MPFASFDLFTQEAVNHLFTLYKEFTGSVEDRVPSSDRVKSDLVEHHHFEYRAGSKWSGHSKFVIQSHGVGFCAIFSPNYDPKSKGEKARIEKAKREFEQAAGSYLAQINE